MVGGDVGRQRRIRAAGDHDEHPGRRALRQQRSDAVARVQCVLVQAIDYQEQAFAPLAAGLRGSLEQFGQGPGPDAATRRRATSDRGQLRADLGEELLACVVPETVGDEAARDLQPWRSVPHRELRKEGRLPGPRSSLPPQVGRPVTFRRAGTEALQFADLHLACHEQVGPEVRLDHGVVLTEHPVTLRLVRRIRRARQRRSGLRSAATVPRALLACRAQQDLPVGFGQPQLGVPLLGRTIVQNSNQREELLRPLLRRRGAIHPAAEGRARDLHLARISGEHPVGDISLAPQGLQGPAELLHRRTGLRHCHSFGGSSDGRNPPECPPRRVDQRSHRVRLERGIAGNPPDARGFDHARRTGAGPQRRRTQP